MNIGLTYDLRSDYLAMGYSEEATAEFDSEETVAAIENALYENGHVTERIGNITALVNALAGGARWDLVFNIAEGLHGSARESQVPSLLEAYGIPCTFSDAHVCSLMHHKPTTKQLVRELGIPTPACLVVSTEEDTLSGIPPFPVFVKPVAEGTSKGITERSVVSDPGQLAAVVAELIQRYRQPVMVERFLSGREVTVGIVGTGRSARVAGVLEICHRTGSRREQPAVYSYEAKEFCEELIDYRLVSDTFAEEAAGMALYAWEKLGGRDAGRMDFRADENGRPHFLEVNPLAGLHPTHSDLPIMWTAGGNRYGDLVGAIVHSARGRMRHHSTQPYTDAILMSLSRGDR
jgi:D-alanine-D-alanine ligase